MTGADGTRITTVAPSFTVVDDATITVMTPAHPAGGVYVQVVKPFATSPTDFTKNWFVFR
ncbi:MAG TPA: hypothetical protein VIJ47_12070 [Acidimicrobiales bacterium]